MSAAHTHDTSMTAMGLLTQRARRTLRKPEADRYVARLAATPAPVAPRSEPTVSEHDARVRVRSLAQILADPAALAPPEAIVPRIAFRGRTTLLAAREKAGKSTMAQAAAAAKSSGGLFLGERPAPGNVLILSLEEHTSDTARRLVEFGANPERLFLLDAVGGDPLDDLGAVISIVEPELVVIDTLPRFVQDLVQDPSNASQWTPVMSALTQIARDSDAGLLLLHHSRKSDGTYRDSSAVGAGVDLILEMEAATDDPTVRKLKAKGRWRMEDFSARLVGERYELASGEVSLDTRVLWFVQENQGCSNNAVRKAVSGKGADIDAALQRLAGRGLIKDDGVGHQHQHVPCGQNGGRGLDEVWDEPPSSELSPLGPTMDEAGTDLGTTGSSQIPNPRGANGTNPDDLPDDPVF